jgi:hypothetical protein
MKGEAPSYLKQQWPKSRQFPRFKLEVPLELFIEETRLRGWCRDIGEGGLGGSVVGSVTVGQDIVLQFQLPGGTEQLRMRAVIRHVNGFIFGSEFVTLNPEQRNAVKRYSQKAAPASEPGDWRSP